MEKLRRIPVLLGKARPSAVGDFADRPPIVKVNIACEHGWTRASGRLPKHIHRSFFALIDTGAEGTVIDVVTAHQIGAELMHKATIHVINESSSARGADIQVLLPKAGIVFECRAVVADLRSAGNTWGLILGRPFLSHCRLLVDGPKMRYQLHWVE